MAPTYLTLKQARRAKDWTQERLEAETQRVDPAGIGVNQRTISKIETGGVDDVMNNTVVLLEAALRLKRGTLVFRSAMKAAS